MASDRQISRSFYARSARSVAGELLGKVLVRKQVGQDLRGLIVETEAYCDSEERDLACHGDKANNGRPTNRTEVMFGPPGHAYVYFTYGMHWMFNIVTGMDGDANAVLIRALEPLQGTSKMAQNRGNMPYQQLTNGPAKLAQALAINKRFNGTDLCDANSDIWIEDPDQPRDIAVSTGPRIGLGKTPQPWLSVPWRFWINDNPFVSR